MTGACWGTLTVEKAAPGPPTLRELADANFVAEAVARELQR
jgi:hypothetical protein